ncbi:hypothetical protein [Falsirhodobacter halotolerans]|uniref:hypothetical protein n=1 Tax=Falsirhodobacter halotolerans TaxID=1146892 RepID=UPI001FD1238A|nr:hypothetical protein [Falsirhodobacter halotolerans]MCJ8140131.1 hypothetical protein [Falsirhodobacter halotolerans]
MPLPPNITPVTHTTTDRPVPRGLIHALDRGEALGDLLRLIVLAAETFGDPDGAAIARAALIAGDHLTEMQAAVERHLDDLSAA